MKTEDVMNVQTAEEARQCAIDWQTWMAEQNLSYGEMAEWEGVFSVLATKFDLKEEFAENGIIGADECQCECHFIDTVGCKCDCK